MQDIASQGGSQPLTWRAVTGFLSLTRTRDFRLARSLDCARSLRAAPVSVAAFSFVFQIYVGQTRLLATGWDTNNERHARLFRRGSVKWPPEVHYSPTVMGDTVAVAESDLCILHHNFADLTHAFEKMNRYSSIEARELLAANRSTALLPGLREAVNEFQRRYSPHEDGGLSFAMSLAIFVYRVLVRAKAAEALDWPADVIPGKESLAQGLETLWANANREVVTAQPAGKTAGLLTFPVPIGQIQDRPYLARLLASLRAETGAYQSATTGELTRTSADPKKTFRSN